MTAGVLFFGGALMLLVDFTTKLPTVEKGEFAVLWLALMAVGGIFYWRSLELPAREILQLAQDNSGLMTVTEITTKLQVSPDLVLRTLRFLATRNLARPSLHEVEKNLWEFPDAMKLPITQAMDLARSNEGHLDVRQIIDLGISPDSAEQTMHVLRTRRLLSE